MRAVNCGDLEHALKMELPLAERCRRHGWALTTEAVGVRGGVKVKQRHRDDELG